MGIAALIPIIAQYGLPLAQKLWTLMTSGKDVTQADWDALNAIVAETPQYHLTQAAAKLGISMDDPRVTALTALIK